MLVAIMTTALAGTAAADEATLVSGSGTSGYAIPDGWTTSGTVEGGSYLKFDDGTITSPEFAPHTGLSFTYTVATFGSGTNHPLQVTILNASTEEVIYQTETATPTSSSYISTGSPLSLGDVSVPFKIQLYGATGKGVRLRNYSIKGTPAGGGSSAVATTTTIDASGINNTDVYKGTEAGSLAATVKAGEETIDNATVTWSGDNDAVATIDATTGAVTLVGAGTVTFTATYAGVEDEYKSSSDTYELTVTDTTPVPTHTATFSVNGATSTQDFEEGAAITFPANPADVEGKTFVGWVAEAIEGTTNDAPEFVTSANMGQSDVTYYAVFAYVSGSGSAEVVDVLTTATFGSPSSYSDWSGKQAENGSDAVYAGQSTTNSGNIQLRATSPSGIITTTSGGKAKKVSVAWASNTTSGRILEIFGSNTAYTSASQLYNAANWGTALGEITYGTSTELTIDGDYAYIGIKSKTGALYLSNINITWSTGGGASYSDYCTTVVADTKKDAELSFAVAEVNANISEQFEAPTLNAAEGFNGTVEYTSSNESVAMVMDSETGELMLLKEGTTTITATFAGNDDFKPGYASYTLNVTDNRIATTITVEDIVLDLSDVASLTKLTPVVKDAEDNIIDCTYEEFPPKVSYEIVSDDSGLIGSLDNNSGDITLNAVVGTATLKAYYNAFNVSSTYKPSECTFTITVESVQTIAEARAQGTGSVTTKGIVTSCSGTTAYIQDADAAICVYGSALTVGDEVKVSGTLKDYNGLLEITSPTVTVLSQNNTVTPEVMTIAEINASENQGWLVKIEAATVTAINGQNTTIAQGENTIVVRGISGVDIAVNDVITLTGNIGCYNTAQIANPTDVTVVELEPNTITVKQRYYYNNEYHYYDIPTDPQYQIGIVNFEHITFVVEANGATATAVSSDNTILEIQETTEANTFEAVGTGGSWEGQVATVTFTTPSTSTHEAAERTITFLVKRPAAPTFSVEPGTYGETQYVELSTVTGSTNYGIEPEYEPEIWYVTTDDDYDFENNDEPDQIVGHKYDGTPIEVSKTTTIKAWTYRYDLNWSEAATATYTIDTTPSIELGDNEINAFAAGTDGVILVDYKNITNVVAEVFFCDADGKAADYDWVDAEINDIGNLVYVINANSSTEARTAYMKVYALDDNAENVYSELITINQAGYVAPPTVDQYALFTGELVEGDYLICYDGRAMNTEVQNDRLQYAEVTPANNVITTDNAAIVWHIAKSGDYWTIYNAEANAYAASTGVKNKAQMLADGTDDMALWTVSGTGEYEFVNKKNAASNVNAYLRNNGSYGFACYAVGTGGDLLLYKKVGDTPVPTSQTVTVSAAGYATLVAAKDLEIPAGVEVYAVEISGNYALLNQVTAGVPAGEAVVVKAEAGEYEFNYATDAVEALTVTNDLVAATAPVTADGRQYVLAVKNEEVGFYKAEVSSTIAAGKGYLQIDGEAPVKGFTFKFGDDATSIDNVQCSMFNDQLIYNLAGQRVSKMQRGINIVNGKKILK